ncbi:MAG: YhbY family RNA-binding protein [Betaproteobacteria bacterium]|jgi:putative YhbY family RNA-binding protein|nr:YhbY family RNA-binding protein [Betaproteobacteria bacterium]
MATDLTPAQRQTLRGRAHTLDPVVLIGAAGLSPAVLAEIHRALDSHELIKIRVLGDDRQARDRLLIEICGATGASPVQHIGKVIVIFRERPEESLREEPPRAAKPAKRTAPRRSGAGVRTRSRRPPKPRRGTLRPR